MRRYGVRMVNLNDAGPVIPLAGLFLAGNSSTGRQFTGGEGGKQYLAGGFAGASSQWAVDQLRSTAGLDSSTVPDELGQAVLGAALSRYGGMVPQNKAMARGIHYHVATQAMNDLGVTAGDLFGDFTGGNGGNGGTNNQVRTQTVPQTHNRGDNMVTY